MAQHSPAQPTSLSLRNTPMKQITLSTLPSATAQEVFEFIKAHLLKQNAKSVKKSNYPDVTDDCMYRGEGGCKCAGGCLMSDEEYRPSWEGHDWSTLAASGIVPGEHIDLIKAMQEAHDEYPTEHWPDVIYRVQVRFGLSGGVS